MAATTLNAPPVSAAPGGNLQPFVMAGYDDRCALLDFLELSYKGGVAYKYGLDPKGQPVLIEHENERGGIATNQLARMAAQDPVRGTDGIKSGRYARRLRVASYENLVRPIVDKIGNYAVRNPPTRGDWAPAADAVFVNRWIAAMVLDGLRFGEAWIGADAAPIPADADVTVAQAAELDPKRKGQPYIVMVDPRRVVDYTEDDEGEVSRVVFKTTESSKDSFTAPVKVQTFYTEWTATGWTRWEMVERVTESESGGQRVERFLRVDKTGSHAFGRCPWWRFRPPFPIEDICELNRALFNVTSLYDEELYAATFTQKWAVGVKADAVRGVETGAGNMLVLESPEAKVGTFGAVPGQADALAARADAIRRAIFAVASMENSYTKNVAESADKRKRDLEGLYTMLLEIVKRVEEIDNALCVALGVRKPGASPAAYDRRFDVNSIDDLIEQLRELRDVPFVPPKFRRELVRQAMVKLDPMSDPGDYIEQAERQINISPDAVGAVTQLLAVGAMTPVIAAETLAVPDAMRPAFIEAMAKHSAESAMNAAALGQPPEEPEPGDGEDDEDGGEDGEDPDAGDETDPEDDNEPPARPSAARRRPAPAPAPARRPADAEFPGD